MCHLHGRNLLHPNRCRSLRRLRTSFQNSQVRWATLRFRPPCGAVVCPGLCIRLNAFLQFDHLRPIPPKGETVKKWLYRALAWLALAAGFTSPGLAAHPGLQYNCLYASALADGATVQTPREYLRFYPDGEVIHVLSGNVPGMVNQWFVRDRLGLARGSVAVKGNRITFSLTDTYVNVTVHYQGEIEGDTLHLQGLDSTDGAGVDYILVTCEPPTGVTPKRRRKSVPH